MLAQGNLIGAAATSVAAYAAARWGASRTVDAGMETLGVEQSTRPWSTLAAQGAMSLGADNIPGFQGSVSISPGGYGAAMIGVGAVGAAGGALAMMGGRTPKIRGQLFDPGDESIKGKAFWKKGARGGARAANLAGKFFSGKAGLGATGLLLGASASVSIANRSVDRLARRVLSEGSAGFQPNVRPTMSQRRSRRSSATTGVSRFAGRAQQAGWDGSIVHRLHETGGRGGVLR